MKHILLIAALALLAGCGPLSRFSNDLNGQLTPYCFQGVTYLALGEHALMIGLDREGKPLKCGEGMFSK